MAQPEPVVDWYLTKYFRPWLFGDLATLDEVMADPRHKNGGACLLPAVMAVASGIEFCGALDKPMDFNHDAGENSFVYFWKKIYGAKDKMGGAFYQAVRHGVAHAFMLKSNIAVTAGDPNHLKEVDGCFVVDVVKLSRDFRDTVDREIVAPHSEQREKNMHAMLKHWAGIKKPRAAHRVLLAGEHAQTYPTSIAAAPAYTIQYRNE
jgi:hypothetical protein